MKLPWATIIASKDWHPSDHCSFAVNNVDAKAFSTVKFSNPSGNGETLEEVVWPVHCVQNSPGSEFPSDFEQEKIQDVVYKGELIDREYYSAFRDIWHLHHTSMNDILKKYNITDVFVVGLALDYCVFNTAIDASEFGYATRVIRQATKPVDTGAWDKVCARLQERGVELIDANDPLIEKVKGFVHRK